MISRLFYSLLGLLALLIVLWLVLGIAGKAPVVGGVFRGAERLAGHPA